MLSQLEAAPKSCTIYQASNTNWLKFLHSSEEESSVYCEDCIAYINKSEQSTVRSKQTKLLLD